MAAYLTDSELAHAIRYPTDTSTCRAASNMAQELTRHRATMLRLEEWHSRLAGYHQDACAYRPSHREWSQELRRRLDGES